MWIGGRQSTSYKNAKSQIKSWVCFAINVYNSPIFHIFSQSPRMPPPIKYLIHSSNIIRHIFSAKNPFCYQIKSQKIWPDLKRGYQMMKMNKNEKKLKGINLSSLWVNWLNMKKMLIVIMMRMTNTTKNAFSIFEEGEFDNVAFKVCKRTQ